LGSQTPGLGHSQDLAPVVVAAVAAMMKGKHLLHFSF